MNRMDPKKFFEGDKNGGNKRKKNNNPEKQPEDDLKLHENLNEFNERLDNLNKNQNEDDAENPKTNN